MSTVVGVILSVVAIVAIGIAVGVGLFIALLKHYVAPKNWK